jgi:hypothetical protein
VTLCTEKLLIFVVPDILGEADLHSFVLFPYTGWLKDDDEMGI